MAATANKALDLPGRPRGSGPPSGRTSPYKLLLKEGGTGLSVAADLPTQIGYDSDDPDVEEEVGRVGVALDSLATPRSSPATSR